MRGPEYDWFERGTAYGALERGETPGDDIRPPERGDGSP
jgi:hypothetical protein